MKTTLVLLPGLNGTIGLFKPLIECAQGCFDVLPLAYPTHEKKTYSELVLNVSSQIQKIKGPYILVGESFSGPISLFLTEKKPHGLLGVVMVASFVSAPNYQFGKYLPWKFGFSLAVPLYKIRSAVSSKENRSFIAAISRELEQVAPYVLAHRIQEIFSVNAVEALKTCCYPIVYFRGVKDYVVPKKNLNKIISIKPGVKVVEFNTQHFLLQSKPEQAVSELQVFESSCA